MEATIAKRGEKEHALMLGSHELGISKTDFDARFHMHAINEALKSEYERGRQFPIDWSQVDGVEQTRIMSQEECNEYLDAVARTEHRIK